MKLVSITLLLAALSFCIFGIVATFEPVANPLPARVIYIIIALLILTLIVRILRRPRKPTAMSE